MYLGERNQSPFVARHQPLNYSDTDRTRGWDIELDSEWMISINEKAEQLFRAAVRRKPANASIDDPVEFDSIVIKAAKNGVVCAFDNKSIDKIMDLFMEQFKWHPTLAHHSSPAENCEVNVREIWQQQVETMHDLCKSFGESWAWEYLWKNWYNCSHRPSISNQVGIDRHDGRFGLELSALSFRSYHQMLLLRVCGRS